MTKTPEELYLEREKRVLEAIDLKVPDQVPLLVFQGFFPAKYTGMTVEEVMNDPEKLWEAEWKTLSEFPQDMAHNPYPLRYLGPLLGILDFKQLVWPGHGLSSNDTYQFVEGEYMKAEEYDHFLLDPTDFMIRRYWPRIYGAFKAFEKLPPLHSFITYYMGTPHGFAPFSSPEMIQALEVLKKAGEKSAQISFYSRKFIEEATNRGFPIQVGGLSQAPFDTLGDFFRGTRGQMLDMYRRPGKLIQACEKLLPFMIEMGVNACKASGIPRVFIPIHKGLDGFMSMDQFKKFFWPTLRELMVALINEGLTPCPLWEGNCTSRLEVIKDIPKGKACYAFEATDLFRAKEILGDTVCIRGNVPLSILATGTPEQVKDYCKKLIDIVGKDGGFILDASTGLDDARPENVRAMFDFTRSYGVY
ncbi:MAG TPA: uroporphyrinogen decarboxylase family protein [Thermodesulfobacteriota bacterium]|nr:uroporphyrinogen decarboxylase family protein [Thermodesulfobacteriota bacterium]